MARVVGGEEAQGRKALSFMYEAGKVPGLDRKVDGGDGPDKNNYSVHGELYGGSVNGDYGKRNSGTSSLFERQPGDDDAAAAFRAMLARGTMQGDQPHSSVQSLQGQVETKNANASKDEKEEDAINEARDRDLRTNLEKAVGRGITSGSGVTLAQQMERFPMLKGAPRVLPKSSVVGDDGKESSETDVVGLNFKPLGQVLRNVKCLKCGQWGHSMGDRECGVSGWNPFAAVPTATTMISSSLPPPEAVVAAVAASAPSSASTRNKDLLEMKSGEENGFQKPSSSEQRHEKQNSRQHKRNRLVMDKERSCHKRRKSGGRRHDRSPSNCSYSDSSSSSSSSLSSRRDHRRQRHHNRRHEYFSDDECSSFDRRQLKSRKESDYCDNGHRSSSRRHKKTHSSSQRQKHRDRHRTRSRSRSR